MRYRQYSSACSGQFESSKIDWTGVSHCEAYGQEEDAVHVAHQADLSLAKTRICTLSTILQVVYAIHLSRYTGFGRGPSHRRFLKWHSGLGYAFHQDILILD